MLMNAVCLGKHKMSLHISVIDEIPRVVYAPFHEFYSNGIFVHFSLPVIPTLGKNIKISHKNASACILSTKRGCFQIYQVSL